MLVYVFGHELTHALWTLAFGGKVKSFKVSHRGGSVRITRTNFLISLAPYFFPLYAAIIVGVFFILRQFHWAKDWLPWFYLLIGAAFSFHLTFSWHLLRQKQSDLAREGYFFSFVVVWLGNIWMILLGLAVIYEDIRVLDAVNRSWAETIRLIRFLQNLII